nr:ribonuclease H-like domain-containing protein [Tanacetum cinerariifolium]
MLRSCTLEWTGNWDDYICLVEFAYNNSWHASIKCALLICYMRVQVSSSSCYFISARSDMYIFILRQRTQGYFGSSRQSHEEKDYSFRQDSLEEPSRARNHLGNRGVYPDFLSSFPSMICTAFPTGSVNVATISQDTASAFIASQSNSSQIKFEDINQIDEDDMEETNIKWNMALLSMRADKFWKRTRKKISIQGSDVAGFDKSKVECFNCHKMGHSVREYRAPRSQERGRKESYRQGSKAEEKSSKALMAIDGMGWD